MKEEKKSVMDKKNIKSNKNKRKPNKSLIAIALAAIITVCGTAIKTFPHTIDDSFKNMLDNNKETSIFDDILNLDETIGIENIESGEIEQVQVEDAITKLEERSLINEKINNLHLKRDQLNDIREESKNSILDFYEENGIDVIIDIYKNKDNSKIDKARIAQQLIFIQDENNKWLNSNGILVSKSILKRLLAAGSIEAYGTFTPEEYNCCEFNLDNSGFLKEIILNDSISGVKDNIVLFPIITDEYYNAYEILQEISTKSAFEPEEIYEIVNKTLNTTKRCLNKELVDNGLFTYTKKHNKTVKE